MSEAVVRHTKALVRERPATSAALWMLVLLGLTYVINAMDRQVFPVLVTTIDQQFHFTLPQGGFLATIFTLGVGLSGILAGFLVERWTRKSVIILGVVAFSVFTVLQAASTGFGDMAVWRFGSGLGEGIQNVSLYAALGAFFYRNRTMALGAMSLAYGIGGYFGPQLGSRLLVAHGWRSPLIVFGLVGFVLAAAVAVLVSTRFTEQGDARQDTDGELVDSHLSNGLWNRNLIIGFILAVISGILLYEYIGLYPAFLIKQLHFAPVLAGSAFGMFGLGAMVAGIPAGYLGDRFNQKTVIVLGFLFTAALGFLIFDVVRSVPLQFVCSFLEGALCSAWLFCNVYSFCQRSVRKPYVARASSIYVLGYYVPASVSGYVFGSVAVMLGWGQAGVLLISVFGLLGLVIAFFINDNAVLRIPTATAAQPVVSR